MTKDPVQTNKESYYRVFGGGSWFSPADILGVFGRYGFSPDCRSSYFGLRLVRSAKEGE